MIQIRHKKYSHKKYLAQEKAEKELRLAGEWIELLPGKEPKPAVGLDHSEDGRLSDSRKYWAHLGGFAF